MELNPIQIGALSSIATELLKFVPFLKKNELTRAATFWVVAVVGTFFFSPQKTWESFGMTLVSAFTTYKLLIQPLAKGLGSATQ